MPMDGLTLGFAARELNARLTGGRIDKVTQPEKDLVILLVRAGNENLRLLLCASPNNARCHLTSSPFANPLEPPAFCMLLRKQLTGGRILGVRQVGGDRVIHVNIDTVDELGDHVLRRLILEVMSRHSNLILTDGDGRILEAVRHVNESMSRVRQVLPGLTYEAPPAQDKENPETVTPENLEMRLRAAGDVPLQKALSASVCGLSAVASKELAFRVLNPGEDRTGDVKAAAKRLCGLLHRLPDMADPRVLCDLNGDPTDALPFPYLSLNLDLQTPVSSLAAAMERCYGVKDAADRIRQKSASMVRLLKVHSERCQRKLSLHE